MTAICGVLHLNGGNENSSDLNDMMQAVSCSDRNGKWQIDNIALGQHTLYNTPESIKEELPFHSGTGKPAIVGDIRLDERAALFSKLAIPTSVQKDFGDAQLVLAAYQKWGQDCTAHLLGDFAFAIWDDDKQQLFCCRDHMGAAVLYYFYNGRKFIFASQIQQILAVKEVPREFNYNKLSDFVVPGARNLSWNESWFEGIEILPAGTTITVDKSGIKKHKYWTPRIDKELHYKTEAEYVSDFRELMFKIVEDRLRSNYPVTALLSGGLDSSSIVSVAAKILEKQNKEINVFSSVLQDSDNTGLKDERYYIELFRSFPNVNIHYIIPEDKGFFSNLEKIGTSITKPAITSRYYLFDAFSAKAEELGSRVILDGVYGELGPTSNGTGGYADMFGRLQWGWLWRELSAREKNTGESIINNFRTKVISPFLPESLIDFVKGRDSFRKADNTMFLQPALAQQLITNLLPRKEEIKSYSMRILPSQRRNLLNTILNVQRKAHGNMQFNTGRYLYPFLDKRMMEFSLSLPVQMRIKNGYQRYMVRAGLDNILPKEIQWRNTKGHFSPDYFRRYNTQIKEVREFLEGIGQNDPVREVVDIEKLKSWTNIPVADIEKNLHFARIARDLLPQAIYLIQFMRSFSRYKN